MRFALAGKGVLILDCQCGTPLRMRKLGNAGNRDYLWRINGGLITEFDGFRAIRSHLESNKEVF